MEENFHIPVLAKEVIEYLECKPQGTYVDMTVGGGSLTSKLLEITSPGGRVIGIDWDKDSISFVKEKLRDFGARLVLRKENFIHLRNILLDLGIFQVDGIIMDLGISHHQFKAGERGFSFSREGPLDMRISSALPLTAADIVNKFNSSKIIEILKEYGEEPRAKNIVNIISRIRKKGAINNTIDLARIVRRSYSQKGYRSKIDPATKTFQALRIAVNNELINLTIALYESIDLLVKGGRICVISFHSLEDRIVKYIFRYFASDKNADACNLITHGRPKMLRIITKKPVTPLKGEVIKNPSARSAKLRVAEKI